MAAGGRGGGGEVRVRQISQQEYRDLNFTRTNWIDKEAAPKQSREVCANAKSSPGSRWSFRKWTVAYFGFFECIPLVRVETL